MTKDNSHTSEQQDLVVWYRCNAAAAHYSWLLTLPLASVGFWGEITSNVIFMAGFWGWATAQVAKIFTCYVKKGVWDVTQVVSAGGMPSSHSSLCMVRFFKSDCCAADAKHAHKSCNTRQYELFCLLPRQRSLIQQCLTAKHVILSSGDSVTQSFRLVVAEFLSPQNLPFAPYNVAFCHCILNETCVLQAVTTAIGVQHGFSSSLFAMALCFSLIVMYDAAGVRRHAGAQAEVLNTVVRELLSMHAVSQKKLKEVLGHTPLQVRLFVLAALRFRTPAFLRLSVGACNTALVVA